MSGVTAARLARAATLSLVLAAAGCATGGGAGNASRHGVSAPPVDSATIALWHFEEPAGAMLRDAGPLEFEARAGVDTRPDFGRVRNGRVFAPSIDSFVYVTYRPPLDPQLGFTVELWVRPAAWGDYEIAPLLHRWTQRPGEQSWFLGLSGLNLAAFSASPGPNYFSTLVQRAGPGFAVFSFQPRDAGPTRTFASATPIPTDRWTHLAVTYDGEVVRFFINGRQDAQYASAGRIRASQAPLLIGNYFDWRNLSEFGGDLRVEHGDKTPYYAFSGTLDEIRLSSVARTDFPYAHE